MIYQNIRIQDTICHIKVLCNLKIPQNIHNCVVYQLQFFKINITKQRSCHSKPHITHQFEKKTIMWLQALPHRNCKPVVSCLTWQGPCSDPPTFLPCCATITPVIKNVMVRRQMINSVTCKFNVFSKYEIYVFQSSAPPPFYYQPPNFGIS